ISPKVRISLFSSRNRLVASECTLRRARGLLNLCRVKRRRGRQAPRGERQKEVFRFGVWDMLPRAAGLKMQTSYEYQQRGMFAFGSCFTSGFRAGFFRPESTHTRTKRWNGEIRAR
ncbi:unnamed protein product, partial [Ectocarpus sp. 8 AP-2014]